MTINLQQDLPRLLPRAIAWAEPREKEILQTGSPLDSKGIAIARAVGVIKPEQIRISRVLRLPLPDDPELREAALITGLLGPKMVGLTLGYGIYLCQGHDSPSLLSHECRHVYQYEQAGSIASYLPVYLQQIVTVGYLNAPFEMDARNHERRSA
jgi:hypothetical protein